ncbi:UPF0058 family protein [Haloparvum sp. PAK95]|uniref:UPF0058 family protein n=1 Tax=Haloparvum sp. PAK95 TaxID=3418962 RepID=UPI003D2EB6A5
MKKRQLIHFHSLLGEVSKHLYEGGYVDEDDLADYRELGTSPMTMQGSRVEHEEAALALADALAGALEADMTADADAVAETDAETATPEEAETADDATAIAA